MKAKFTFKAKDGMRNEELHTKVAKFYEGSDEYLYSLRSKERNHYEDGRDEMEYLYVYKQTTYFYVYVDYTHMNVLKRDSHKMAVFNLDELEFFDRLGFEIEETHVENIGQDIEEWYGKTDES